MEEVLRWGAVHACNVVALQECEQSGPYAPLLSMFVFSLAVPRLASLALAVPAHHHLPAQRAATLLLRRAAAASQR